jgi:hypothetical protein
MSIELGGGSYSASEIIQAIAESNDPTVDLTTVEAKLDQLNSQQTALLQVLTNTEARIYAIEAKLSTLPTTWSFS